MSTPVTSIVDTYRSHTAQYATAISKNATTIALIRTGGRLEYFALAGLVMNIRPVLLSKSEVTPTRNIDAEVSI